MTVCPHCAEPVREATLRRSGRAIRLNMETAALGNIAIDDLGFASFIPAEARFPKHVDFVAPEHRYVSHRATCAANERTRADVAELDRRLRAVR